MQVQFAFGTNTINVFIALRKASSNYIHTFDPSQHQHTFITCFVIVAQSFDS